MKDAPKSPELVHAEAELTRLRDAASRLTWERDTLKRAATEITALGDDAPMTEARQLSRDALTQITATM